ncbi:MAG: GAF domain-containing sensor histidine kinase [Anaerolineae bacterium]|nr:GAF domain-containing sensor histidine kinase [Anaerolineae bacterium]
MSKRMIRRLDLITAYVRWLGLVVIPIVAFLVSKTQDASLLLFIVLGMAVVDAVPVAILALRFFPEYAALIFIILDALFSLVILYLGGPGMVFYAFIPAIAMGIRFDWSFGLATAGTLALGHILIALVRAGFRNVGSVLLSVLPSAFILLLASVLSSLLADGIKKEPPLDDEEQKAQNERLRYLQAAADRARLIYEMASTLSATLNHDKILNAVLEISSLGFDELTNRSREHRERPAGAVFLFGEEGLFAAASRNIGHEEVNLSLDPGRGVLAQVLQEGNPVVLKSLVNDPELSKFTAFRRCRSSVCVPLRAGFDTYGIVVFASPAADAFNQDHVDLLTAVTNQAAVALTNAQLYQDLQDEKERVIAVHEEERTKLSRDLHDGPTQSISAIAMRLNFARLLLEREPTKVKDELFKLENLARRTTKEIRTMLFTLRPVVLETQGLKAAVEQLVDKLKETTESGELPVVMEFQEGIEDNLDINIKAVAWYIAQETLNNAKKYAKAEHIWVRMYIQQGYFIAEIQDDGVGFDFDSTMATYDQRGSFGLLSLQERADLVNGRTIIRSQEGKGTKVTMTVPLRREAV